MLALFAALALVFCGRFLWPGRTVMPLDMLLIMGPWRDLRAQFPGFDHVYNPMLDPVQQYFPWQMYWTEAVHRGVVPLWNEYAFAGMPFLANLQSAVFYPGKLLFAVLPTAAAFGWTVWLHLVLASWFTYLFARAIGIGRWGGVVAGVAYAYCGYAVGWIAFPTLGQWVSVWLPLLLLCFERAMQTRRATWVLGAAAVVAMQFLGGHLQVSFYVLGAFAAYALYRVATAPRTMRLWGVRAAGSALALGVLLAAVQLLPTIELARISVRDVRPLADLLANVRVPWSHLALFVVPNFFGNPVGYNYWGNLGKEGGFNFQESGMYVGAFTLLLAAWAVVRRRPRSGFFTGLVVVAVLLATGSPLFVLLYHALPGFDQLGGLGRVLVLACFGLAMLAGAGVDDLAQSAHKRATFVALVTTGALVIGVVAALVRFLDWWPAPALASYTYRELGVAALVLAAGVILVALRQRALVTGKAFAAAAAAIVIGDLFLFGVRYPPAVSSTLAFPPSPLTQYLQATLGDGRIVSTGGNFREWFPPNTPMAYHLADVQGSDSLWWRPYAEMLRTAHPQAPTPALDPAAPVLDRLSVTEWATTAVQPAPGWRRVFSSEAMRVYENQDARPRAFVAKGAQVVRDDAISAWQTNVPWQQGLAVSQPIDGLATGPPSVVAATDLHMTAHSAAFTVDAAQTALAVLADPLYPGWRVTVDGAPATPVRVDGALRGVVVPQGWHTVVWKFRPGSYVIGLFATAVGVLLMVSILVAGGRRDA